MSGGRRGETREKAARATKALVTVSDRRFGGQGASGRKAHLDEEAPFRPGAQGERGAMGAGDGVDYGQTQPMSAATTDPFLGKLLERPGKPRDLVGPDHGAGIPDHDARTPGGRGRRDLHLTPALQ
jgi:hypothetical protein